MAHGAEFLALLGKSSIIGRVFNIHPLTTVHTANFLAVLETTKIHLFPLPSSHITVSLTLLDPPISPLNPEY